MDYLFSRKKIIYVLRLVVAIVLAYFILFSPVNGMEYAGYGFIAFYLATCLAVYYIPERWFYDERLLYFLILFDTLMIAGGIYLSGMAGTDLYLVYFFIICLAAMGSRFGYMMLTAMVFAVIYGMVLYGQGYLAGEAAAGYLLRLPFILVIAMLFGFLASITGSSSNNRLKETERQYQMLFDHSDTLVFMVNWTGEFLSANPKLYTMYGFSSEIEMLGLSYGDLHDREETDIFVEHISRIFETGESVEYEAYNKALDRWFSHSLSPVKEPEKSTVFAVGGVSRDITERVKKEMELQKTNEILRETREQLIQKDKMASLGRLASGIAHEIRNPMEIILMGVEYLETAIPKDSPTGRASIDRLNNAVDRVNNIINEILKFSRKTTLAIEKTEMSELMDEILDLAGHHLKKNAVSVDIQRPPDKIEAGVNRNMLEQVLLNIIYNAVDAMSDSPRKTLSIAIYEETTTDVGYKTGYRKTDYFKIGEKMVTIEITDTGKGMDETVARKIFEPFFTTKDTGKGTGLGLSLAHMIIDRMSGTIDVKSRPGEGATFFIRLQPASNIKQIMTKDETDDPFP